MALYTKEQIEKANSVSLEVYLGLRGEKLKRVGSEYILIYRDSTGEHDSISIRGNRWYDHKNMVGGYTIKFLQEFYGLNFREAVRELLDGETPMIEYKENNDIDKTTDKNEHKSFSLPEKAPDMRRLFAYLTKNRFINQKIVQAFIEKNILYQEKKHGNIVFVGTDNDGNHKSASEKSTVSNNSGFKITVSGSDSNYGFCWRGAGASLFVFEAAVDLMSFVTLNGNSWQNNNYLSIDGLSSKPLIRFLEENKMIKEINICLDYDPAGIETAEKIRDTLLERGYTLEQVKRLYPVYKDWNEQLKAENGLSPIPAKIHPKKDAYSKVIGLLIKVNEKAENSYIQWRNKCFEKYGRDFYLAQIKKELCKIEDFVKNSGDNIKQIEAGVLRIADLSVYLMCMEGNKSYRETLCVIEKEYKVYKDKGHLSRRIEDLKREIDCLSKDMEKSGQSLFLLAKSVADTAIRTEIYIKTDYASDMERKHNFEKSPKKDVMKNEITHIKGDEEQCLTL